MKRIFVAPHLDDGAISAGGTFLAERAQDADAVHTVVATVFSRSSYTRDGFGDALAVTATRQAEERAAMAAAGVDTLFLDFPECSLRGYTISHPLDYPKQIRSELDAGLEDEIAARFRELFQASDEVLVPLAAGDRRHVDHRLVRHAAVSVWETDRSTPIRFYEDIPYLDGETRASMGRLDGVVLEETPIDLEAKVHLTKGYTSQPIEAWEELIRSAAGQPPVERVWTLRDAGVLRQVD